MYRLLVLTILLLGPRGRELAFACSCKQQPLHEQQLELVSIVNDAGEPADDRWQEFLDDGCVLVAAGATSVSAPGALTFRCAEENLSLEATP